MFWKKWGRKKNPAPLAEEAEKERTPEILIEIVDTPEKFRSIAQELVPSLVELLRSLSALEGETFRRSQALKRAREARGEQHVSQEEQELWTQYKDAYGRCWRAVALRPSWTEAMPVASATPLFTAIWTPAAA